MIKHLALALLLTTSAAHAEIYTWRAGGTDFYTNSLDEIPARYLKKARVLDVATGKKGALATARPVAAPGTATAAGTATLPAQGGAPAPQGAAPVSGSSTAAAPPAMAPEPVAVTTPPRLFDNSTVDRAALPPQGGAHPWQDPSARLRRRGGIGSPKPQTGCLRLSFFKTPRPDRPPTQAPEAVLCLRHSHQK